MIAQENRPLAAGRNVRRLADDLDDRIAVFLRQRHVQPRHEREVIGHVAFVAGAEIFPHVFRPLVRFGQENAIAITPVQLAAHVLYDGMGLGQVLVAGPFALAQVGNRIQPQAVHTLIEPEAHGADHCLHHVRIVEIQVRLVGEETVPVIRLRDRVPGPVGGLGIGEDDARAGIALVVVAPDVVVALDRAGRCAPRSLEPGMLVGGVVDHQLGDDPQAAPVRLAHEVAEIGAVAVLGRDMVIVGDVVAVVAHGRRVEGQQPERVDAQVVQVIQLCGEAGKIADAVVVAVEESLDVKLVDDRVLVPRGIVDDAGCALVGRAHDSLPVATQTSPQRRKERREKRPLFFARFASMR